MSKLIEKESNRIDSVTLYEEYRLIEKDQSEINMAWRGVQLLLFFLAFVFGSLCTFCFHMLMFLFDEKCVLFPKLISLKEMRNNPTSTGAMDKGTSKQLIYDYISSINPDTLPVDFVATHWVEKKTCYLPTYEPLLSGICGLIWTTMFLMCSSGSRALTGLQRAWRILPTVFVFSLAMGGLSVYTSFITQAGLNALCLKLAEITGTTTCSYTINVATLPYERRIRGVYQATRLTIISAWLHTFCWLGAAITALFRIILVVDFRLVKVKVELRGNIEKMLERHEKHIRTDEFSNKDESSSPPRTSNTSLKVRFLNKGFGTEPPSDADTPLKSAKSAEILHFISQTSPYTSNMSLMADECRKLAIKSAYLKTSKKYRFIVQLLHSIVDKIGSEPTPVDTLLVESDKNLVRQQGMRNIQSLVWSSSSSSETESLINREEAEQIAKKFRHILERKIAVKNLKLTTPSTLTPELSQIEPKPKILKSNLSNRGTQTVEVKNQTVPQKVQISSPKPSILTLRPPEEQKKEESTTDILRPMEQQDKKETTLTLDTLKSPEEQVKKEMKSTIETLKSSDKEKIKETTSTTDTLVPLDEKDWKGTVKESENRLLEEKPDISSYLKNLVESLTNNEDTLVLRPVVSSKEKMMDKDLDVTVEKGRGKSSKDDGPSNLKEEKPQEPGPSHTNEERDQRKEKYIIREKPKKTDRKEKQD